MDDSIFERECECALRRLEFLAALNIRAIMALQNAKSAICTANKFACFKEFIAFEKAFLDFVENHGVSLQTIKGANARVQKMRGNLFGAVLCNAAIKYERAVDRG